VSLKTFHLGDVLSITTGTLLSPRGIEGVYDILNWMTDDNLYTHQLPRVMDECTPYLLEQHPQLRDIDAGGVSRDNFREFLQQQIARFGETLEVRKLPAGVHYEIDPLSELAEKVHPSKIIIVDPDPA
jgi:hypothetical protein